MARVDRRVGEERRDAEVARVGVRDCELRVVEEQPPSPVGEPDVAKRQPSATASIASTRGSQGRNGARATTARSTANGSTKNASRSAAPLVVRPEEGGSSARRAARPEPRARGVAAWAPRPAEPPGSATAPAASTMYSGTSRPSAPPSPRLTKGRRRRCRRERNGAATTVAGTIAGDSARTARRPGRAGGRRQPGARARGDRDPLREHVPGEEKLSRRQGEQARRNHWASAPEQCRECSRRRQGGGRHARSPGRRPLAAGGARPARRYHTPRFGRKAASAAPPTRPFVTKRILIGVVLVVLVGCGLGAAWWYHQQTEKKVIRGSAKDEFVITAGPEERERRPPKHGGVADVRLRRGADEGRAVRASPAVPVSLDRRDARVHRVSSRLGGRARVFVANQAGRFLAIDVKRRKSCGRSFSGAAASPRGLPSRRGSCTSAS